MCKYLYHYLLLVKTMQLQPRYCTPLGTYLRTLRNYIVLHWLIISTVFFFFHINYASLQYLGDFHILKIAVLYF